MIFKGFHSYPYPVFEVTIPVDLEDAVLRLTHYNPRWAGPCDRNSEWPLTFICAININDLLYGETMDFWVSDNTMTYWLEDIDTQKHQTDYRLKR